MKRGILTVILVILSAGTVFGWRPLGRYYLGADAIGVANAYVGSAETELAVQYNPAGLVQIQDLWTFAFEFATGIRAENLLNLNFKFYPDFFPFFCSVWSAGDFRVALSFNTLFDGYMQESLFVRALKVTAAYRLFGNFSIGAGCGPVFAFESSGIGYGFAANIGLMWKISEDIQLGACFHFPVSIDWHNPIAGSSLTETYPAVFDIGMTWKAAKTVILYASMEYVGIDEIKYILNGVDHSPVFDANLLSRLHPHFGVRFLEAFTGAHISCGLMIDSDYYETGGINQYLLTLGVRAYAKNAVFYASIIDALLFSIFNPYNTPEERITIGVTFQIY